MTTYTYLLWSVDLTTYLIDFIFKYFMGLNFILWSNHILVQSVFWSSIVFLIFSLNYTINWYDMYSRSLGNEFYLNVYYCLWTTFWYIPLFIFCIIIIQYSLKLHNTGSALIYIIYIMFMLIFFDLHLYWTLNILPYLINTQPLFFNSLLLNSINKFHPGLLYWSSLYIISFKLDNYYTTYKKLPKFTQSNLTIFYQKKFIKVGLILLCTLGLGGWWAWQEGSWGGWWNWDPSEVFGLLILLFFIKFIHHQVQKQANTQINYSTNIFFLILFQIYFFTQINFDLVSHNFGTKIDNFIDNTNLYLLIIMLIFVLLITDTLFFNKKQFFLKSTSRYIIPKFLIFGLFYTYGIVVLFTYELCYGLIPLINDFLWKIAHLNISNWIIVFEKYNLELTYLIILNFWYYNSLLVITPYLLWVFIYPTIISYVRIPAQSIFWFHFLLFVFIWISLVPSVYTYTRWNLTNVFNHFVGTSQDLTLNSFFIDHVSSNYVTNKVNYIWNTFVMDTTLEVYSFLHALCKDITCQRMVLGDLLFVFNIEVMDILSCSIITVVLVLILIYTLRFTRKLKIIF